MTGREVGRYALIKLIGCGGMAEVWTGKMYGTSGFEKVVAVKLLSRANVDKELYQKALTDEALIQVHLKHPNIVDIFDLNVEGENPYMVMEYVEGVELRHLLSALREKKGKIDFSLAAYIIYECSKALSYAHNSRHPETGEPFGIIHRDVSPSNILLSAQGEVKLSDFGIAKSILQSTKTQVGQLKGKFRYMSPEQARGADLDYRSDIYSLGLVFYEVIFGRPAYECDTDVVVLKMAQTGDLTFPEKLDPELEKIFKRLLARDPGRRYSDLGDFRRDLKEYTTGKGGIADYDDLKGFLESLKLPQIRAAIAAKKEAEEWEAVTSSRILDNTGQISILDDILRRRKRRRWYWAAGAILAAVVAGGIWLRPGAAPAPVSQGTLKIETTPADAIVDVRYGKVRLSRPSPVNLTDLPLGVPISLKVAKEGYKTAWRDLTLTEEKPREAVALNLAEVVEIKATFTAEPYAEVSIPGKLEGVETPAVRVIQPGRYEVTFIYPPSGAKAVAELQGVEGGAFTCSADMAVGDDSGRAPSASCRQK